MKYLKRYVIIMAVVLTSMVVYLYFQGDDLAEKSSIESGMGDL